VPAADTAARGRLPHSPIPKSRLEALTDGIFAITMTLLVLDLHFPAPGAGDLFTTFGQLVDHIDNYVISFVVLGLFWLGHVRMMGRMREADGPFAAINLAFVLFTTLMPPLTTLLGDNPGMPQSAVLYGANLVAILSCELLLWHRVCHRLGNATLGEPAAAWRSVRRRYALSIGVVVAGIAIALAEIRIGASEGLAPWMYLLLIGMGLMRPPLSR
jgi:uncharacterized membrane protein